MWSFIAYYLRFCRNQRGLSGEAVGRVITASKATVSRIEKPDVVERMDRQAILDRAFVMALMSEAALRWPVGSPRIMREQLAHVLEMAEQPNIVVHVIPQTFETGAHPGLDGGVKLVTGDAFGEVAYTESLGGGRLISSPKEVAEYAILFARISAKALPEHRSKDLIKTAMEAFSDDDVAQEQSQRHPIRE